MRFRISSFILLSSLLGFAIGSCGSHRNAIWQVRKVDTTVDAILNDVYPGFRSRLFVEFESEAAQNPTYGAFKANYLPGCLGFIYAGGDLPYLDPGNERIEYIGGPFTGSTTFKRKVVLAMTNPKTDFSVFPIVDPQIKVDIEIEICVPWGLIAGRPKLLLRDNAGPTSASFLDALTTRLDQAEIEYQLFR